MKFIDLTGQKFGRLTVISRTAPKGKETRAYWLCKCECGNTVVVSGKSLRRGLTQSCGCLAIEVRRKATTKHGLTKTRLDNIYFGMKSRCLNHNEPAYKWYGARGITICDKWLKDKRTFFKWAKENGYKENLTIDRIDVNGNYEPSNCRWVNNAKQCRNRRSNHIIEYNGEKHSLIEWSEILGISYRALLSRLKRNWSIEKAFTTPNMVNQYAYSNNLQ